MRYLVGCVDKMDIVEGMFRDRDSLSNMPIYDDMLYRQKENMPPKCLTYPAIRGLMYVPKNKEVYVCYMQKLIVRMGSLLLHL